MDIDDFLDECAVWTTEIFDYYNFTPLPIKPKEVSDYEMLPLSTRNQINGQYFIDHPQINAFYNTYKDAVVRNKAMYDWLKDCKKRLHKRAELVEKINKKMDEYPKQ